eukprot:291330_1
MTPFVKKDNSHRVYEFKECDNINDVYFLIPFGFQYDSVSIYVKSVDTDTFTLMKTFEMKRISNEQNNKIEYLFDILKILKCKIKNERFFWHQIGFTIDDKDIEVIVQLLASYDRTTVSDKKFTILHKLVYELKINELLPILRGQHLQLLDDKAIAFNVNNVNKDYHEDILQCEYLLVGDTMTPFVKKDNSHRVYEFKECDNINDVYFLIPFGFQYDSVSIYVKFDDTDTFSLMKTFEMKRISNEQNNKIKYLFDVLKVLKCQITNARIFFYQTGFNLEQSHLKTIKNKFMHEPKRYSR